MLGIPAVFFAWGKPDNRRLGGISRRPNRQLGEFPADSTGGGLPSAACRGTLWVCAGVRKPGKFMDVIARQSADVQKPVRFLDVIASQ